MATTKAQLRDTLDMSDWVTRALRRNSLDEFTARLQSGLAILASVGSTAPFVGLFGTVWGIYHALLSIGAAGQATIDQVAGPVGESLIMTALGLAVAIPAVLGYNGFLSTLQKPSQKRSSFGRFRNGAANLVKSLVECPAVSTQSLPPLSRKGVQAAPNQSASPRSQARSGFPPRPLSFLMNGAIPVQFPWRRSIGFVENFYSWAGFIDLGLRHSS